MIKREELSNPNSCINKAADEEPVFVLRAQDLLSDVLVDLWARRAEENGASDAKVSSARELAQKMRAWPTRKFPG